MEAQRETIQLHGRCPRDCSTERTSERFYKMPLSAFAEAIVEDEEQRQCALAVAVVYQVLLR